MAVLNLLSVDIRGEWSERQLKAILKHLEPELKHCAFELRPMEVTTHSNATKRFIINVVCKRHNEMVQPESCCEQCLNEVVADVGKQPRRYERSLDGDNQ